MKLSKKLILTLVLGFLSLKAESATEAEIRTILQMKGAITGPQKALEKTLGISQIEAKLIALNFRKGGWNAVKGRIAPYLSDGAAAAGVRSPSPLDNTSFQQEQAARKRAAARGRWKKIRNVGLAVSGFHSRRKRAEEAREIASLPPPPPHLLAHSRSRSPSPDRGRAQSRSRSSSRGRSRSGSTSSWVHVSPDRSSGQPAIGGAPPPPPPPPPPALSGRRTPPQGGRPNMAALFAGGVPQLRKTGGPQSSESIPKKSSVDVLKGALPPVYEWEPTEYQKQSEREQLARAAAEEKSFQEEQAQRARISQAQSAAARAQVGGAGGPPPPPPPPPPPGMRSQGGGYLERAEASRRTSTKKQEPPKGFAVDQNTLDARRQTMRSRPTRVVDTKPREETEFERATRERKERASRK